MTRVAFAPGRVNLIGDHTDYTGGLVLPMAIHLGTTVRFTPGGRHIELRSDVDPEPARVGLDNPPDPRLVEPMWARFVAAAVAVCGPDEGGHGEVTTTLPVGSGLSSSAALEVALALALQFDGDARSLAEACRRIEELASGVPCGIMDQLASAAGVEGAALLLDCESLAITPVPLPEEAAVVVVHSGRERTLAGSAYAERRAECQAAAEVVGDLRTASVSDLDAVEDERIRRRARHVVTENARVLAVVDALRAGDLRTAGAAMVESHASLRDDFEVSVPELDALVEALCATPGVYGARLTGAGFGGCAVALAEPGVSVPGGWVVRPAAGAHVHEEKG